MKVVLLHPPAYYRPAMPPSLVPVAASFEISSNDSTLGGSPTLLEIIQQRIPVDKRLKSFDLRQNIEPEDYFVALGPAYLNQSEITDEKFDMLYFWVDRNELATYSLIGIVASNLLAETLFLDGEQDFLADRSLYVFPVSGLGTGGMFDPEVFNQLVELVYGYLLSEITNKWLACFTQWRVRRKAKKKAQQLKGRGIKSIAELRKWAESREKWTTKQASKQLGLDSRGVEQLFTDLGYFKRETDQCWRLGELEEYRSRRQAWIEKELF